MTNQEAKALLEERFEFASEHYKEECMDYIQALEKGVVALEKQLEYETLEEQGLLIKLPCKVGDIVYLLLRRLDNGKLEILKSRCLKYIRTETNEKWSMWYGCKEIGNTLEFTRDLFGKEVFFTKREAEKKLAELEGGVE